MLTQVTDTIGGIGADPPAGLLAPFSDQVALLTSIPGVGECVATVIVSEIGVDMSRFPTAARLAAWSGLAPGNNESGGRRRRAGHRKGNTPRPVDPHRGGPGRLPYPHPHRGPLPPPAPPLRGKANKTAGKKAEFAVAHTLIKVIWKVLATGQPYTDLGHDFYTCPRTAIRSSIGLPLRPSRHPPRGPHQAHRSAKSQ
jgi:hypothetical protein